MKTTYYRLIVMLLVITAFNSCTKDDVTGPESTIPANEYFGNGITINAIGRVVDESGAPISGATVKSGSKSTTTDNMGIFALTNINAFDKLGFVIVEKDGYFKGIRSFIPKAGGNELSITLLSKSNSGSFNSADGGTVSSLGVSVTIEPNSVQLNNAPYNGIVNVALKHINPAEPNFRSEMPGSLVGVDSANSYGLVSYGMMAVELTSSSGQKLQIESGKTAEIRLTVPASLLSNAPSTIPLWSLDETIGVWKKESSATLVNNVYIGNVSHFSFWNADYPYDYIYLTSKVFDAQNNLPLAGYIVTIMSTTNMVGGADITNSNGEVGGMVPSNEVLNLTISKFCNGNYTNLYSSSIGPFSSDVNLDSIFVNTSQLVYTNVSGQITDCNNQPLSPSYVVINGSEIVYTNNGVYNVLLCDNNAVINAGFPWQMSTAQLINLNGTPQVVNFQICRQLTTGTVTDFDGNVYRTVVIGSKTWTTDNLRSVHFKNGTIIPTGLNNYYWNTATTPCYSTMYDDTTGDYEYGKVYNWYAVADPNGLCPAGWHVPSDSDWIDLINLFGGELIAAPYLKEAGYSHWDFPNTSANNISGFTATPGGLRLESGSYGGRGDNGHWWSSSDYGANVSVGSVSMYKNSFESRLQSDDRNSGLSVRCVKN